MESKIVMLPNCLDCGIQLKDKRSKKCKKCVNRGSNSPCWKGGIRRKKYNKELHRLRCRKYNENNPDKRKKSYINYMIKNRELIARKRIMPENKIKKRNGEIKKAYGISIDTYEQMLYSQNSKCAICNNEFINGKNTHIDHNHKTGKIRQLLCNKCNLGLGHFCENIEIMKLAINYLERWS